MHPAVPALESAPSRAPAVTAGSAVLVLPRLPYPLAASAPRPVQQDLKRGPAAGSGHPCWLSHEGVWQLTARAGLRLN